MCPRDPSCCRGAPPAGGPCSCRTGAGSGSLAAVPVPILLLQLLGGVASHRRSLQADLRPGSGWQRAATRQHVRAKSARGAEVCLPGSAQSTARRHAAVFRQTPAHCSAPRTRPPVAVRAGAVRHTCGAAPAVFGLQAAFPPAAGAAVLRDVQGLRLLRPPERPRTHGEVQPDCG